MKTFLTENIKFDSAKFTSGFYAIVLLIGGELGLWLNGDLKNAKVLLGLFTGFIIVLGAIMYLFHLNGRIKSNIEKLKDYESD